MGGAWLHNLKPIKAYIVTEYICAGYFFAWSWLIFFDDFLKFSIFKFSLSHSQNDIQGGPHGSREGPQRSSYCWSGTNIEYKDDKYINKMISKWTPKYLKVIRTIKFRNGYHIHCIKWYFAHRNFYIFSFFLEGGI